MLDVEFTIENGVLYLLQCRSAKKSAIGAVRLSMGMFLKGLLPIDSCLKMVEPKHLDLVVQDKVILESSPDFYVKGIPACSGVVSGVVCQSLNALKAAKLWHTTPETSLRTCQSIYCFSRRAYQPLKTNRPKTFSIRP